MLAIMDIFCNSLCGAGILKIYDPLDTVYSIHFLYVYMRLKYIISF